MELTVLEVSQHSLSGLFIPMASELPRGQKNARTTLSISEMSAPISPMQLWDNYNQDARYEQALVRI